MAKISFTQGIKCTRCGHLITEPTIYTKELCQKCGAHLFNINYADRNYELMPDGKEVTIKVTHKLFHNILEEV